MLNNLYVLELETEECLFISEYSKNRRGLQLALDKVEAFIKQGKRFSAFISCTETNEVVWSSRDANLPEMPLKNI